MKQLLRTPLFWLSFSVISLLCIIASFKLFPYSFPLVQLNITMDRNQAREQAQQLAANYNLGSPEHQHAAAFKLDALVKNFVELDAGGKQAFVQMMQQNLYHAYTWQVRHFKYQDPNEVLLFFTPEGKPYGFVETLSEQTPGPSLDEKKARTIAQQAATDDWHVDLEAYHLVESSKKTVSSGRTDHTFVYERSNERIGDGFYRLKLKVSGDKLTTVKHEVKVPEAFERKYQEMRSANEVISTVASLLEKFLYLIGGCIIGLFFLLGRQRIIWRPAAFWAALIASLMAINNINQLPLVWMQYDTALSPQVFLFSYLLMTVLTCLYFFSLLLLTFSAAESLTRAAFGHHPQLWKVWSDSAASSIQTLGRTIGGYLSMPILLLFVITFYSFTTRFLNWWVPSDTLYNPNVLAAYLPWLSSISISLFAGFREECLFRAVPLACAALIGQRFGRKRFWIIFAFILQALIFGAVHANYPMQPAYARLVELFIPSLVWGGMYLAFGLLPTIISHVIFDVALFSLPIFASSTTGALLNKIIIILLSAIPLCVVLASRIKNRMWSNLSEAYYNASWQPSPPKKVTQPIPKLESKSIILSKTKRYVLFTAGLLGLLFWVGSTQFTNDAPTLRLNRMNAITKANEALKAQGVDPEQWYALTSTFAYDGTNMQALKLQRRFVWQEGGKDAYAQLLGTHIIPPYWLVRFVKFEGDIAERAEEYRVYLPKDGSHTLVEHILPESAHGVSLDEKSARTMAHAHIQKTFSLDPTQLEEISAESTKQPNRLDWTFTFANPRDYPIEQGQARIKVVIGGNQVTSTFRYVHVPQEWERAERNKGTVSSIINMISLVAIYILFIAGTTIVLARWNLQSAATLWLPFILFFALLLLSFFNAAPLLLAQFNTSEPFYHQVFKFFGISIFGLLLQAAAYTLTLSVVNRWRSIYHLARTHNTAWLGLSIGCIFAGLHALLYKNIPSVEPLWADYSALGYTLPILSSLYTYFMQFIIVTMVLLLFFAFIEQYSRNWQQRKILSALLILLAGFVFIGSRTTDNIPLFLISGLLTGIVLLIVYITFIRFDHSLIPISTGSYVMAHLIQQACFNAWPGAAQSAIGALLIIGIFAWQWFKKLQHA